MAKSSRGRSFLVWVLFFTILFIASRFIPKDNSSDALQNRPKSILIERPSNNVLNENNLSSSFLTNVQTLVKSYGDFEVSIWTKDGALYNEKSEPPFEIIINTTSSQVSSCFDAKSKLFNIMKSLYTSDYLKNKISRVRFSAWGYLQASLGSSDLGFSREDSGPTNFFKVLLKYKPYENEIGDLATRTWGKSINGCE